MTKILRLGLPDVSFHVFSAGCATRPVTVSPDEDGTSGEATLALESLSFKEI